MKRIVSLLSAVIMFSTAAFAVESEFSGFEIGGNVEYDQALGTPLEFQVGKIGGNFVLGYQFPLSNEAVLRTVGITFDICPNVSIGTKDFIQSWWGMNFFAGANMEFSISPIFIIRPQIQYGLSMEIIDAGASVSGVYCDQILKPGVSFLFTSEGLKNNGIFMDAGIDYSMIFEQGDLGHYLSVRFGIIYKFKNGSVE